MIHPGELHASRDNELIGTVLGSCVAVCLHDNINGISGMNHYMLPAVIVNDDIHNDESARYGFTAINTLLEKVLKLGANRKHLSAKLFGGGHITSFERSKNIPKDNIRLARLIIEIEDIPIVEDDVGDNFTRKILMDVKTGHVFLKKSTSDKVAQDISDREQNFSLMKFSDFK